MVTVGNLSAAFYWWRIEAGSDILLFTWTLPKANQEKRQAICFVLISISIFKLHWLVMSHVGQAWKQTLAGGFQGRSAIVRTWNFINPVARQCDLASAEEVFHCSVCVGIWHHIWSQHNQGDTDSRIRIHDCLKALLPLVKLNTTSVWGFFFFFFFSFFFFSIPCCLILILYKHLWTAWFS